MGKLAIELCLKLLGWGLHVHIPLAQAQGGGTVIISSCCELATSNEQTESECGPTRAVELNFYSDYMYI